MWMCREVGVGMRKGGMLLGFRYGVVTNRDFF